MMRVTTLIHAVRHGQVLAILVLLLGALAVIGFTMIDRGVHAAVTGAWGREHLVLRLLAESATEELLLRLQQAANAPGDEVYRTLRQMPVRGASAPIPLPGLRASTLAAMLSGLGKSMGGPLDLVTTATLHRMTPVSVDPLEHYGLVRLDATVTLGQGARSTRERVRIDHSFRCAKVSPPRPLDQVGFFLAVTTPDAFPNIPAGKPIYARAKEPVSFLDLMVKKPPDGVRLVPDRLMNDVKGALRMLGPGALSDRAQFVTKSADQTVRFLSARLGGGRRLSGVLHCLAPETLTLSFPSFRGRLVLSALGQVRVGDVKLADPTRDSLTIVSLQRIVVTGRQVDATLVNFSDMKEGIVFARPTRLFGSLLSTRFPVGLQLMGPELGQCQVQFNPALESGTAPDTAPDDRLLSHYFIVISPSPVLVEHLRDREEPSSW